MDLWFFIGFFHLIGRCRILIRHQLLGALSHFSLWIEACLGEVHHLWIGLDSSCHALRDWRLILSLLGLWAPIVYLSGPGGLFEVAPWSLGLIHGGEGDCWPCWGEGYRLDVRVIVLVIHASDERRPHPFHYFFRIVSELSDNRPRHVFMRSNGIQL